VALVVSGEGITFFGELYWCSFILVFFDNQDCQWPTWTPHLHTRTIYNIWHWHQI